MFANYAEKTGVILQAYPKAAHFHFRETLGLLSSLQIKYSQSLSSWPSSFQVIWISFDQRPTTEEILESITENSMFFVSMTNAEPHTDIVLFATKVVAPNPFFGPAELQAYCPTPNYYQRLYSAPQGYLNEITGIVAITMLMSSIITDTE